MEIEKLNMITNSRVLGTIMVQGKRIWCPSCNAIFVYLGASNERCSCVRCHTTVIFNPKKSGPRPKSFIDKRVDVDDDGRAVIKGAAAGGLAEQT
jgi:ribosomal protein S27AE